MAAPPTSSFQSLSANLTQSAALSSQTPGSATSSRAPSPARGAAVSDNKSHGPNSVSQSSWQSSKSISKSHQIRLRKISHMRYQHEDLNVITRFFRDFGMKVVRKSEDDKERWFSGYGSDQYVYYARQGPRKFLGSCFEVEDYAQLERIIERFSDKITSKGIERLDKAPGGGFMVSMTDPEGFPINFIFGQDPKQPGMDSHGHMPERLANNDETTKPRERANLRFKPGPAAVHKLGHFGYVSADFSTLADWYTREFNIVPSDILYLPQQAPSPSSGERKEVAYFCHIDRGQDLVDHHTLFISSLTPDSGIPEPHVHHSSFEVHDFDTQALGHQWLSNKGYESVWGLGRHILGSQVFDYWWDTSRFMVEHYADGDLVNEDTNVGFGPAGHEGLAVWGPDVPMEFLH